jgi:glycosidase
MMKERWKKTRSGIDGPPSLESYLAPLKYVFPLKTNISSSRILQSQFGGDGNPKLHFRPDGVVEPCEPSPTASIQRKTYLESRRLQGGSSPMGKCRLSGWFLMLVLAGFCVVEATAADSSRLAKKHVILGDIYYAENAGKVSFGNNRLELQFHRETGNWLGLRSNPNGSNLFVETPGQLLVDFQIEDEWIVAAHGSKLLRQGPGGADQTGRRVSFNQVFEISSSTHSRLSSKEFSGEEYQLVVKYALFVGSDHLERSLELTRKPLASNHDKGRPLRLAGFRLLLPDLSIIDSENCLFDAPGPWFPTTFLPPSLPVIQLPQRPLQFHSAPDGGFGLMAVRYPKDNRILATWMDTRGETGYNPTVEKREMNLSLGLLDRRALLLQPSSKAFSDIQHVELTEGPLPRVLARYRGMIERTMPLDRQTPSWVPGMVILEVFPSYYKGGFKELTGRLPFYRQAGFNTLYLMPHWKGGYSPLDLFAVEPAYGTVDDLKVLVRRAHDLGLKVLFDMVIHGFNSASPVVKDRPDLFIHEPGGQLALHPTWKSVSTDWAAPAYHQYMRELVEHDLREYDIDGYRVDAASFKGPNWDPKSPYPAYLSAAGSPALLRSMLAALRKQKPDTVLLNEVFGPVFYTASNLSHDNQTEAPQLFLEKLAAGEVTAAHYQEHLANVFDMLPEGANRVFYTRNHDTSWFYHFNGYTPAFMAMEVIHAFCGIPEVFAGDPSAENRPSPDEDPSVYESYRRLFSVRSRFPEWVAGKLLLRETPVDNPALFAALRRGGSEISLLIVSLSAREETAIIHLNPGIPTSSTEPEWSNPLGLDLPERVSWAGRQISVKLRPFQVIMGRYSIQK